MKKKSKRLLNKHKKQALSYQEQTRYKIFHNRLVHVLIIAAVGLLVYSNTFKVPFVFDDAPNIVENPDIRSLNYFIDSLKLVNTNLFTQSRFIGYLTFALNYKFGGLNVTGYHIVNLIIHIFNAILVYYLVVLTFKTSFFKVSVVSASSSNQPDQSNLPTFQPFNYLPLFVALLFVCHPIQTQAVTYIVQRFASLAALFYLLSLVLYIKFRIQDEKNQASEPRLYAIRYTLYAFSLISAVLAMRTKEISFTLPFIIILYEFMFFREELKKRLLYLGPIILLLFIIPLTFLIATGSIASLKDIDQSVQAANFRNIPRWDYLLTQFRVIVTYIRLILLPVGQNLDYEYHIQSSLFNPQVLLSFLLLLLILCSGIYIAYLSYKKNNAELRLISFGIFWFFITLSVESSIIPISDVIFEHRLYLPATGFFITAVTALMVIKGKLQNKFYVSEKIIISSILIVLCVFSFAAYERNKIWQNSVKLWGDVLKKSPGNIRAHSHYGNALLESGLVDEAIRAYKNGIEIMPDYAQLHVNLGTAYLKQKQFKEAIDSFNRAIKLSPDLFEAYFDLGLTYTDYYPDSKEAIRALQTAVNLNPSSVTAHNKLGEALFKDGQIEKAISEFKTATEIKPYDEGSYNNLGVAFLNLRQFEKAAEEFEVAVKLNPNNSEAHYNLGVAYLNQRLFEKALNEFQTTINLKPDYAEAHNNIGIIYAMQGHSEKAIDEFKTALNIKPDFADALRNLKFILSKR